MGMAELSPRRKPLNSLAVVAQRMNARLQKDPKRDAESTVSFHRMLATLKPPRKPIDGIKVKHLGIVGWVRMDIRFLK